MHVLEMIIGLFAPHQCVGCGSDGDVLCSGCARQLTPASRRCYRCHRPSPEGLTCQDCRPYGLDAVRAAVRYRGAAKRAVHRLKFERARAAADRLSLQMALVCSRRSWRRVVVVPVPTAASRARVRGYDQAVLLARGVAAHMEADYAPLLRRHGRQRQVGASGAQRRQQLQGAFSVSSSQRLAGRHVVIIDDVITTGATLEAAAQALRAAGARSVEALVFAQA